MKKIKKMKSKELIIKRRKLTRKRIPKNIKNLKNLNNLKKLKNQKRNQKTIRRKTIYPMNLSRKWLRMVKKATKLPKSSSIKMKK